MPASAATSRPVFRTGANIDRMVEKNEKIRDAELYAKSIMNADQSARWHTAQYRPIKCPMQRMQGYDVDMNTQAAQELHHKVGYAHLFQTMPNKTPEIYADLVF